MSEVCCFCSRKVWDTLEPRVSSLEGKIEKQLTKKYGCSNCGAGRNLASDVSPEVVTKTEKLPQLDQFDPNFEELHDVAEGMIL